MIWENLKMAIASLRASKLRSFLTMLGIIIGIAAVVSINAIGDGVKKSVTDQITGLGSNIISISSGKAISKDKNGKSSIGNVSSSVGASTLTQQDVATLGTLSDVDKVAPLSLVSGVVAKDSTQAPDALLIGTSPDFISTVSSLSIDQGHFFRGDESNRDVVVLGSQIKDELFPDTSPIGQAITIRGTTFTVVGFMKSVDTGASSLGGAGGYDTMVIIPSAAATKIAGGNTQILRIVVKAKTSDVNAAVDQIKAAILKNHGGQEDFSALTQADLVSTIDTVLGLLATFITAIASIALLVGGIGIMNMMLVSVTERTREIGIRKAIGATRTMLMMQFLIEAIIITLFGGVLGCLAAVGMATLGGHLAKITPVFTPNSFITAFVVSVVIGIVFGLAPAIKASRKRPIEALRYE